jgi:C4-dicarboxylate transporter, DctM subunit
LLLFVIACTTNRPLWAIVREAAPFILAAIAVLSFITIVPEAVLCLPWLIGYKG